MTRRITILLYLALFASTSIVYADQLSKGDVEIGFRFSYSNLDFDGQGGSSDSTVLEASAAYMLTDHHEVGAGVAYSSFDSSDQMEYGARYTYNFRAGQSLNPYVAATILGFGGDRSDVFDWGYAADFGVKVYPWTHGGVLFGATYRELTGARGGPDANQFIAFGGLSLKF